MKCISKFYCLILVSLFFCSCKPSNTVYTLSESIKKFRLEKTNNYQQLEKKADKTRRTVLFSELNQILDGYTTTFMVEGHSLETGETYATIWNSKGEVNFKYDISSHSLKKEPYFSEGLKNLVESWDIKKIRNNSYDKVEDGLDMTASRFVFEKNSNLINIEEVSFKEWFNIDDIIID